jgi:hypothetical protein
MASAGPEGPERGAGRKRQAHADSRERSTLGSTIRARRRVSASVPE